MARVVAAALVVAIGASSLHGHAEQLLGGKQAVDAATLRYSLRVSNPTSRTVERPGLSVFAPAPNGVSHRLTAIRSNQSWNQARDVAGNSVLNVVLGSMPPYSTTVVTIEADVVLSTNIFNDAGNDIPSAYRIAEPLLEIDDPDLQALARTLKDVSPLKTAHRVFEWTRDNVHYEGYVAETKGARQAFVSRAGDCTEYAYLSAALARAAGVPARVVGGFVVTGHQRLRATDYHDWTEVYVDGRWVLLDAQRGVFDPSGGLAYVAFEYRSATSEGEQSGARRFSVVAPLKAEFE